MRDTGVVIVAGGSGSRAADGDAPPKQFRWIGGKPMLLHSLHTFQSLPEVAMVVCVLPRRQAGDPPPWLFQCDLERLQITAGGETRTESVRNGLEELPAELPIILVHDAARPFVTSAMVRRVIACARLGTGAVPCVPIADTVKRIRGERVTGTEDRESLVRAQTPQGFPREMLINAHMEAMRKQRAATDDAALCELSGSDIRMVEGEASAMKVTSAVDFGIAESLWRQTVSAS